MRIVTIICNVAFWGFFCMVMLTDGPPKGINILWSLLPFLVPVANVAAMRALSSLSRIMKLAALTSNILWLGIACWRIARELPSHPKEEGLLEFVLLFALTPLLSAMVIGISLRAPEQR